MMAGIWESPLRSAGEVQDATAEETTAVTPGRDEFAPTDTIFPPQESRVVEPIPLGPDGMGMEAVAIVLQEDSVLLPDTAEEAQDGPTSSIGEPDGPVENQPACADKKMNCLLARDEELDERTVQTEEIHEGTVFEQSSPKESQDPAAEEPVAVSPAVDALKENGVVDDMPLAHDGMVVETVAVVQEDVALHDAGGEVQDRRPESSIEEPGENQAEAACVGALKDTLLATDEEIQDTFLAKGEEIHDESVLEHDSLKEAQDTVAEDTELKDSLPARDEKDRPKEAQGTTAEEPEHKDSLLTGDEKDGPEEAQATRAEEAEHKDSLLARDEEMHDHDQIVFEKNRPKEGQDTTAEEAEHEDSLQARDEEMHDHDQIVFENDRPKEAQDTKAEEAEHEDSLLARDEEMDDLDQIVFEKDSPKEAQDTTAKEAEHKDFLLPTDEEMHDQIVFEKDSPKEAQNTTAEEAEHKDSLLARDEEMHDQSVLGKDSPKAAQDATTEAAVAGTQALDGFAQMVTSVPHQENGVVHEISLAHGGVGVEAVAVASQVEPSAPTVKPEKHESRRTKKHRKRRHKNSEAKLPAETVASADGEVKVLQTDEPERMDASSPLLVMKETEGSAVTEDDVDGKTVGPSVGSGSEVKAPVSVQTKRKGHRKRKRRRKQDDTDDGGKVLKKGKTDTAGPTTNAPPAESTSTPTAVAMSTRKITFKTRLKTSPKTPPEVPRKTAPKTPPKAPPKSTHRSTTHRGGRRKKDDDGYAFFCALCQEFGTLLCCEKCKQAFHLACLGLDRAPDADPWMCDNCVENKVECFDCKVFTAIEEDVLLCSFKNCSKYFHEECSKKWDRWDKAQLAKTSASKKPIGFTCPHHICDACGNARTPKRSRLYRCLYCPVAYHENCAPDGTQFLEDVPGFMSCWKHDDDWKREIQTGEQIRDLKTFFQQLPLPGVSNDFQVPQFIHEAVKKLNRKPAPYSHIRRNIYLAKKPRRRSEDEGMQCPCKRADGSKSACEKDCLCGMLLTSCSSSCECGDSCKNVPFQKRPGQKLKAVKTQNCGWGLRADVDIRAGEFLVEYVGEVIDDKLCEERLWALKKQGETNFYMCEISREMVIDATFKGNLSRYINHSCEPNTELQKWNMEGEVRIGVFAISDIKKGDFITYDYQFIQFGTDQQCHCGSTDCRGQLGVRSNRPKDLSMSPLMSRPLRGSKFIEHSAADTIGRVFRHRRDQCVDSGGTKDLQYVRYNSAEAMKWVGHRVGVWWPLDQKYYRGQIVSYNAASKKHVITYDDGDLEDLNMSKETWLLENIPVSHVRQKSVLSRYKWGVRLRSEASAIPC